ncbi:MAG: FAD-dependent oxidoreductase [Dehalococcoidia bacterium]
MVTSQFKYLFSPFQLRNLTLRNRIVSTAHTTSLPEDGMPGDRYTAYNAEKAKGGCGLIITFGSAGVHHTSAGSAWGEVDLFDDMVIPYLRKMADAVHGHGAKIISQMTHRGRRGTSGMYPDPLLAPSAIPERTHRETPHEMEIEDIRMIQQAYVQAALRVKKGGFDGAEILVGYHHLPEQFLSPFSNRRTDEYGGALENRMRFTLEVIDMIRSAVGEDFVVGLRIGGDERIEGGIGREEYLEIVKRLASTGKVDYLNVVGTTTENLMAQTEAIPPMWYKTGVWLDWAAEVKQNINVPVIAVGRILDPLQAEWVLADGQADLVAMTRAQIADPQMANKAMAGRLDDIRPCIGSLQGCLGRVGGFWGIGCIHNPAIGREEELAEVSPAATKKKVVVVGGGPTGLEAARVAAERGHSVVLFEKKPVLGGQITPYSKAPGREDFGAITLWLEGQARKLGVDIRLGVEATESTVLAEEPDAVIVATGSEPIMPDVPGAETGPVVYVEDVLTKKVDWGAKVLVLDQDGHHQGPAVAELLADQGRQVEIVSDLFSIGEDMDIHVKPLVYERLFSKGVTLSPNTAVKEVREERVVLENVYSHEERVVDGVTTIVYAGRRKAEDTLYKKLKEKVSRLFLVGDATAPRKIHDAILAGTKAGREI